MATDNENGILLGASTIEHLFGSTYKDILEATDKLRRWNIDPSKKLRSDLHTLSILITRVNETSKASFAESSIIATIYDAIAKDLREELRRLCNFSSWEKIGLLELIRKLHDSPHTMLKCISLKILLITVTAMHSKLESVNLEKNANMNMK